MVQTSTTNPVSQLAEAPAVVRSTTGYDNVVDAISRHRHAGLDGAWGSSKALALTAIAHDVESPAVIILPRIASAEEFAADLVAFGLEQVVVFPAWESLPQEVNSSDVIFGRRLKVLTALESGAACTVVASVTALLQPVPSRESRSQGTRRVAVGDTIDDDELLRWFQERGLVRVTGVESPGEFRRHGGIIDVFPAGMDDPLRIEMFGDEIESIRHFDVESQRKTADLNGVEFALVPPQSQRNADDSAHLLDSLAANAWVGLVDPLELREEARRYLDRLPDPRGQFTLDATLARCADRGLLTVSALAADPAECGCHLRVESIERISDSNDGALAGMGEFLGPKENLLIACHNAGEQQRVDELIAELGQLATRIRTCVGSVSAGFRLVAQRLVVIGDHELFNRRDVRSTPTARLSRRGRAIDSFLELSVGDLVVHVAHGIGKYLGMKRLEKDDREEEHLVLEFRDGVRMYVPASLIHLVQKYIGGAKSAPKLSKLGTGTWEKKKKRVAAAVSDMAVDMLRLQAVRASQEGIQYPPQSHWQHEFEAAFPYTETPDQLSAIASIKADMESSRPMDRLICGDVGYGKTEVAMRAAFRAIEAGKQVAVLVPTTVLAEQHFRTFSERMAEYPVTVDVLSRFRTKQQQRGILEAMAAGTVDLVVGTHRLVSADVRFRDLGLVVIDEEQRFGVSAKERLKELRLEVDVLTLSATPIPRTLHMALLGIRDISNLETPPQQRMAVSTRIHRFDDTLIRNAVIRELNRNGQVFFVHNRVHNIQVIADRLQRIVPEATIDIGHGQMREGALEEAMVHFVNGETDILVCTTIIESGLDIPNANTIIINEANHFGLADLHQLRGRVGRYHHRAYCYLLLDPGRSMTPSATKRLKAIEEYSELGAGFRIAMRDLEIRGAGNLLGTQQSGHIAAVGYELYCQLLENAVRGLKNEPAVDTRRTRIELPVAAYLSDDYVPSGREKVDLYRRLAHVRTQEDLEDVQSEMRDRFGPLPHEAMNLVRLGELQVFAGDWSVDEVYLEDRFAVLKCSDAAKVRALHSRIGQRLRVVSPRVAYLELLDIPHHTTLGDDLLHQLKAVLQPE